MAQNLPVNKRENQAESTECGGRSRRFLRHYYLFMILFATVISSAVWLGVRNGWLGSLKTMDQVCGFFCFPHDLFYPTIVRILGLGETPAIFGISLWAIIFGFAIIFCYFAVLFLPFLLWRRSKSNKHALLWGTLQAILLAGHLYLYSKVLLPTI